MTGGRAGESDLARARAFIASQTWTFAKTVPETPHEYLMVFTCTDPEGYRWFAALITAEGHDEWWSVEGVQPRRYRYLTVDGYDYWHVGHPGNRSLNRRVAR